MCGLQDAAIAEAISILNSDDAFATFGTNQAPFRQRAYIPFCVAGVHKPLLVMMWGVPSFGTVDATSTGATSFLQLRKLRGGQSAEDSPPHRDPPPAQRGREAQRAQRGFEALTDAKRRIWPPRQGAKCSKYPD